MKKGHPDRTPIPEHLERVEILLNVPEGKRLPPVQEIFPERLELVVPKGDAQGRWEVFKRHVLFDRWIWLLATANIFVYIVRIGVDNLAPLYTREALHFTAEQQMVTIFYFEAGAFIASLLWGYASDLAGGRRAAVAILGFFLAAVGVYFYAHAETYWQVQLSLLLLGTGIFAPQLLIGVSSTGFVPQQAIATAMPPQAHRDISGGTLWPK